MEIKEFLDFISTNGLAVVLCVYFVLFNNKTQQKANENQTVLNQIIEQNTSAINELKSIITTFITSQSGK
jgi:hypothetical protein